MTGIEHLRQVAQEYFDCSRDHTTIDVMPYGVSVLLNEIAAQIAREHAEDCFRMGERAAEGKVGPKTRHEMALSLLDDWEREAVERESDRRLGIAADVSMSAYDLLPADERAAIAWVREHGGIAEVNKGWSGRVPTSSVERMVESHKKRRDRLKAHALWLERKCHERQRLIVELNKLSRDYRVALNGVCERLGLTDGTGLPDMPEIVWSELDRRLMPESMEWPRFEDGEPVKIGEEAMGFSHLPSFAVDHVVIFDDREATVCAEIDLDSGNVENFVRVSPGERVKRPASKVLDADGAEVRVGDEVFVIETGKTHHVTEVDALSRRFKSMEQMGDDATWLDPMCFTHRAPVLAADGKPLRVGETVWHKSGFAHGVVESVDAGSLMHTTRYRDESGGEYRDAAKDLTHERPAPKDDWKSLFDWVRRPGIHTDADFAEFERRAKALAGDA